MNISITKKNSTENKEALPAGAEEKAVLSGSSMPFSEVMKAGISETALIEGAELKDNSAASSIDMFYDAVSMDINDALFFINLAHEGRFSLQTAENGCISGVIQTEIAQTSAVQKSAAVTNQVINLLEQAQNTQKPVRISFDNDISVVLKIDKKGKLSAEFIPGSVEAERYLAANVSSLKQKFDEQNLPYTSLSYRQNGGQNKNSRKKDGGKGEQ